MARSSGNTLSLNNLAGATGNTQNSNVSLNAIAGGGGTQVSLDDFAIDSVDDSLSGYTYAVESTNENYQITFDAGNPGSKFISAIAGRADNFTWTVPVGSKISLGTNSGQTATFAVGAMTNAATQTILQSVETHTVRGKFADGYNDHATRYNTNIDKTVYSVDSYDGNADSLCLDSSTPITLADGTTIQIGDVEEGTILKSKRLVGLGDSSDINFYDWNTDSLETEDVDVNVVNVVFSFSDNIYNINNGEIICTNEHPLLVKRNGVVRFRRAESLVVGDYLVKYDESDVEITSIERDDETREVVTLDVDTTDIYLANGYITHNKGGNSHSNLANPGTPATLTYTSYNTTEKMLEWTKGTESGTGGVTAYDVQVDDNVDFSSTIHNYTEYSGTSLNVVALSTGTYYARVRSIDHGLKSGWKTLTFTR